MHDVSAVETALHGLRTLIADGSLQPGDRLPSEGVLSERIGVSRGSIREAIRTLSALGVVETRRGAGTFVGELRAADMIRTLALTVGLLPLESILELFELRRVLEAHAASLAAARCDDAAVSGLSTILDRLETSTDVDEQSALDHEFHMAVARLGGNESLGAMVSVLRSRSRAYPVPLTDETKRISDAGHRTILGAVTAHDPVAASVAAAAHVAQSEVWLREHRPAPEIIG
ncbi:FadR/GntR family transcriptional regulator [Promicromonospora iranensis]|uniref:FadR/GntR family transcriptional regulator n=1 Tax=Promicromonospora iranensis TaxID=1105144 RepID=UPI0023AA0EA8|nr:FCD domain-containing protein [Promicromonospora iranensis]